MIVALTSVVMAPVMRAEDDSKPVTVVNINKTDGTLSKFYLPSRPVVNVTDDKLVVTGDDIKEMEFLRSDVSHIDFGKEKPSAAVDVAANEFVFSYLDNSTVRMSAAALTRADLYDLSGNLRASATARDGAVTLSLESLPAGIYLVAPDCHPAIKIVRK